ncbi:MAG: CopG family antitoxin [Actinomycetota bacterium]|nr:CopG family antitoxin [Actinomycetota bacterium]
MSQDRFDALIDRDWSDAWETLPDAPDLVPRVKSTQITLRLPATMLARVKRVAATRALPYHTLVRSWLVEGLRTASEPQVEEPVLEAQTAQLNIKLDQAILDALKARAHELHQPYHRLARELVEWETEQAEAALGLDPTPSYRPAIKELMVLLLHAPNKRGSSAVRGMTRLQKLLFVIEQKLEAQSQFYAFNYGPFNEEVNDAARALEIAGFIRSGEPAASGPPSFKQMIATVTERAGPADEGTVVEFALNDKGHKAAETLRHSSPGYDHLFELVASVRQEWDKGTLDDLIDRVYETYPKYAEESVIKEQVARRAERRRSR